MSKEKEKDRLIEYLLLIQSQIDDAYNAHDAEWIVILEELRSQAYKDLSVLAAKDEEEE